MHHLTSSLSCAATVPQPQEGSKVRVLTAPTSWYRRLLRNLAVRLLALCISLVT